MSWVLASTRIPSPAWRRPELSTTGLIYMRARYYDPAIGRFISEDSAKDGGNWYAYAGENPVGMVDADGRTAFCVHRCAFCADAVCGKVTYRAVYTEGYDEHDEGSELVRHLHG